jgi:hypothetical protein
MLVEALVLDRDDRLPNVKDARPSRNRIRRTARRRSFRIRRRRPFPEAARELRLHPNKAADFSGD